MNLMEATLVKQDSKMLIDGGAFRLDIPDNRKALLAPYTGKPVKFGVRPEDIHDKQFTPVGITPAPMHTKVDITELMGNEIQANLLVGGKTLVARLDPRTRVRPGEELDVAVDLDNMHVFDPQTERAIL